jgi:HTH-type transcriptional regulator/antitoxin HipB
MAWTNSYSLAQTGNFLRAVRRQKGISQADFAAMIGVSHATLSSLENGKSVSSAVLERALQFLGMRLVIVPKSAAVTVSEPDADCGSQAFIPVPND